MSGDASKQSQSYTPYQQWPEYHVANDVLYVFKPELLTSSAQSSVRWHLGPLHLEETVSDIEPTILPYNKDRFIFWQRISRHDIPKGWHTGFFPRSPLRIGYTTITEPEYWKKWPENMRYYRRKWYKEYLNKKYRIERVTLTEFKSAYLESSIIKKVGARQLEKLERKMSVASEHIDLWCARNIESNKIVAGLAVINSPTHASSNHFVAFMLDVARPDRVNLGLVDHWFNHSLENGITLLDFGIFWQKGDPKGWKGFAEFKGQFGITYISLPPRLFRFKFKNK